MLCHVMLCCAMWSVCTCMDLWDHYLEYLRDHLFGLILFFWLIPHIYPCIAVTSFASVLFPNGACHESSFFLRWSFLSRSCVFWWFPTGLSFYFTFRALPSSSIYLLLTKHAGVIHVNIYSAFRIYFAFLLHFCRFNLPTALYVFLGNFVYRKYRCLYALFLLFSVKTSCDLSFTLLRFFSWSYFVVQSCCFFVLRLNFILTKYSRSHLSKMALYSFASLDLVVSGLIFVFSHLNHPFLLSSSPSFEIGLYTSALWPFAFHFSPFFSIYLRSFSFLFGFAFNFPFLNNFLSVAHGLLLYRRPL